MPYRSTKHYGHELGLSACFRQWRAESHCRLLHGYALAFTFVFEADKLDVNNWVVDFGSLKPVKEFLANTFDHKLIVAEDDPRKDELSELAGLGLADVLVLPSTGCEAFAEHVANKVKRWLFTQQGNRVRLVSVECREHGANSALWVA